MSVWANRYRLPDAERSDWADLGITVATYFECDLSASNRGKAVTPATFRSWTAVGVPPHEVRYWARQPVVRPEDLRDYPWIATCPGDLVAEALGHGRHAECAIPLPVLATEMDQRRRTRPGLAPYQWLDLVVMECGPDYPLPNDV